MNRATTVHDPEAEPWKVDLSDPRLAPAAAAARAAYRLRGLRNDALGQDLFSDPAWDILLDLFIAACDGQRLSVSAVCVGARCPSATALRYLTLMMEADWIYRVADTSDGRRFYVVLRPKTMDRMLTMLER